MALTRTYVETVMAPYLKGDFESFVRDHCTSNFTYQLVPGDLSKKLNASGKQHEFSGTFIGHDAAVKMILEGLTGHEVKVRNSRLLQLHS